MGENDSIALHVGVHVTDRSCRSPAEDEETDRGEAQEEDREFKFEQRYLPFVVLIDLVWSEKKTVNRKANKMSSVSLFKQRAMKRCEL